MNIAVKFLNNYSTSHTTTQMKWKVRLTGNERGLETLAESFTEDPEVFEDDDNFFLWSSQFEGLEDADEVRDTAEEIVRTI